jgi:hypothetical protein
MRAAVVSQRDSGRVSSSQHSVVMSPHGVPPAADHGRGGSGRALFIEEVVEGFGIERIDGRDERLVRGGLSCYRYSKAAESVGRYSGLRVVEFQKREQKLLDWPRRQRRSRTDTTSPMDSSLGHRDVGSLRSLSDLSRRIHRESDRPACYAKGQKSTPIRENWL